MIGFVDLAMEAFIQGIFNGKYPVAIAPPEYSRSYIATLNESVKVGPGITVWRADEQKTEWASNPMATKGFAAGRTNQGDHNQMKSIPVEVDYIVRAYCRESSDLDEICRGLWFSTIYKNLPVTVKTVGKSQFPAEYLTPPQQIFLPGTASAEFEMSFVPIVPGTTKVSFGDTVVAQDSASSNALTFISGYAAFSGTVNYTTGIVTITTTDLTDVVTANLSIAAIAAAENEIDFFMKQSGVVRDWEYDDKTKKVLWYSLTKHFYVQAAWVLNEVVPQIKSIQIIYKDGSTHKVFETQTVTPNEEDCE